MQMVQKRELFSGVVKTAERLTRHAQEMGCAVDANTEDTACRSTEWHKDMLARARPAIQRRCRSL